MNWAISTELARDGNANGRGLIQTFVFECELEMCGVCRDNLPGHLTGHIYGSAALHSCSIPLIRVKQFRVLSCLHLLRRRGIV